MAKVEHPKYGTVSERSFPAAALDADQLALLETFKKSEVIHDFQLEGGTLTLWRPWLDGESVDVSFCQMTQADRAAYSCEVFKRLVSNLASATSSHGALHPGNMILVTGKGIELVDAGFNNVLHNPEAITDETFVWLWGKCVPKDWSHADWDRVSALRVATLLAQHPSTWETRPPDEDMVGLCRRWLQEARRSFVPGSDDAARFNDMPILLDRIGEAIFESPEAIFERHLAELETTKPGLRVLLEQDEEQLLAHGEKARLGREQIDVHIGGWLAFNRIRRESELRTLAEELLRAGLWGASQKLVVARSCSAAERVFTHHGIEAAEAGTRVWLLLSENHWIDEREASRRCHARFDELTKAGTVTLQTLATDIVAKLEYPSDVATRLAELELERQLLGLYA